MRAHADDTEKLSGHLKLLVHVDDRVGDLFHGPLEGGLAAVGTVNKRHPIERSGTILLAQACVIVGFEFSHLMNCCHITKFYYLCPVDMATPMCRIQDIVE